MVFFVRLLEMAFHFKPNGFGVADYWLVSPEHSKHTHACNIPDVTEFALKLHFIFNPLRNSI